MRRFVIPLVALLASTVPVHAREPEDTSDEAALLDTDGDGITNDVDACPEEAGGSSEDARKNGCTPHALAHQWVVDFLVKYAPPGRPTYYTFAKETKEEALARYDGIADDLLATVYDPKTKPLFAGPTGRAQTASILLGIMFWETSFRRDVDFGLGEGARGDNGESWCLMQLKIGDGRTPDWNVRLNRAALKSDPEEDVVRGFTGPELVENRRACFSEGLKVVRGSFGACHNLPLNQRLSSYASGSCDKGHEASERRVNTGVQWFYNSSARRLFKDEELLESGPRLAFPLENPRPSMLARVP